MWAAETDEGMRDEEAAEDDDGKVRAAETDEDMRDEG